MKRFRRPSEQQIVPSTAYWEEVAGLDRQLKARAIEFKSEAIKGEMIRNIGNVWQSSSDLTTVWRGRILPSGLLFMARAIIPERIIDPSAEIQRVAVTVIVYSSAGKKFDIEGADTPPNHNPQTDYELLLNELRRGVSDEFALPYPDTD